MILKEVDYYFRNVLTIFIALPLFGVRPGSGVFLATTSINRVLRFIKELIELTEDSAAIALLADKKNTTVIGRLYRSFRAELNEDNEDKVAAAVYGKGKGVSYPAYQKLKARLRNQLIDALLENSHQDKPNYENYANTYRTLQRQYAAAQILMTRKAYKNCVHVLERIYRVAAKKDIIEMQYQAAQMLMGLYLGVALDRKKYARYAEAATRHRVQFTDLGTASAALYDFKNHLYHRIGQVEEIGRVAIKRAAEVEVILHRNPKSHQIAAIYFELIAFGHYLSGDFVKAVEYASEGEAWIKGLVEDSPRKLLPFRLLQLRSLGFLGEFEKGMKVVEVLYLHAKPGSINWIKLVEDEIFFCIRNREYQAAYVAATRVTREQIVRKLPDETRQLWEVIDAFLYFLIICGKVDVDGQRPRFTRFRLTRFLNSVPGYAKEKRGMNIQILAIHTMFLIVLKRYDEAIDRVEALEKYCSRYLRNNEQLRSNCFIKMLTSVVKGNFHEVAAQRHAKPYWERLKETAPDLVDQAGNLEIIPYEELWEILLKYLGTKVYKSAASRS